MYYIYYNDDDNERGYKYTIHSDVPNDCIIDKTKDKGEWYGPFNSIDDATDFVIHFNGID